MPASRPSERTAGAAPLTGPFALAATSGLVGMAVVAPVDRALDLLVSERQRRREQRVRTGSPHAIAGPTLATKLIGRNLTAREARGARMAFSLLYGAGWGLVYALIRARIPRARRCGGLPFALPFYALCDGILAPALRLGPPIARIPWQFNAKELANHVVWTASTELVHRSIASMQR